MNEKIVRGITFREDGAFIEPDQKIDFFLVKDEDVKDVKEMLDRAGKEFKREPGLVVRRARSADGDLYEITFWDQFKTYATVSKPKPPPALSPRQRRALKRARLNAWLQQRAGKQGRPKARARRRARKRVQRLVAAARHPRQNAIKFCPGSPRDNCHRYLHLISRLRKEARQCDPRRCSRGRLFRCGRCRQQLTEIGLVAAFDRVDRVEHRDLRDRDDPLAGRGRHSRRQECDGISHSSP
jgi:hypothetical protein